MRLPHLLPRAAGLLVLALVAALLAALAPGTDAHAEPIGQAGDIAIERFGGADRVETAIEISQAVFDRAETVVVARADDYADALVGAPLAAQLGGPILLTDPAALSAGVAEEIARLGAGEVVLLGGEQALSPAVEDALGGGAALRRVFGASRFGTAAAIAAELPAPGAVFVAEGQHPDPARGFPDALSVAPYAAFTGGPVLLVTAGGIPDETARALTDLAPGEVVVVGGEVAVSAEIQAQIATLTGLDPAAGGVRRLAGADRYGTSAAVYDEAVTRGLDPAGKWLATGRNFPDALAAGPAVAAAGQTFLLVDGQGLEGSPVTAARLPVDLDVIEVVALLGQTEAIADGVAAEVEALLTAAGTTPDAEFCLTVLHNNDGESQLVNAGGGLEEFGGIARFASLVRQQQELALADADDGCAERGVLTVTSGDNFLAGPELSASLDKGVPFYDSIALDYIGYDALALGNHDFDFGPEVTADFIEGFTDSGARFVSANLDFSAEPDLQALVDRGVIVPSTMVDAGSRQIGVLGLTTPLLPQISSPRGVVVSPELVDAVEEQVAALEAQGADHIVLISHLQDLDEDLDLVGQLSGVDIVVGGGGDETLAFPGELLVPGDEDVIFGTYPYLGVDPGGLTSVADLRAAQRELPTDADGRFVPVVTTTGDYRYLGRLKARFGTAFDAAGTVFDPFFSRMLRVNSTALPYGVEDDPFVTDNVVDPVLDYVADLAENVIGTSQVALDGRRETVRGRESNLGNLLADSQIAVARERAAEFGLDPAARYVGIQNGGGIRNNTLIPAGPITELTTFDIAPFANFTAVFPVIEPAELKRLLEHGYANIGGGQFAQIGGMTVEVDPSAPAQELDDDGNVVVEGSRVRMVTLDDGTVVVADGVAAPAGPDTNVSVVAVDFLARGGDGYPFPAEKEFTVIGTSYQQALADYIADDLDGVITAADYPAGGEGRILGIP